MKTILSMMIFLSTAANAAKVDLVISNLNNKSGKIYIALFNDAGNFPDKTPFKTMIVPVQNPVETKVTVEIPDGEYAVSTFLDENGNGKLDGNLIGIPKERFGFSNNPRILTGAPSYQDCEVSINDTVKELKIRLIKLL